MERHMSNTITIDGTNYDLDSLSQTARDTIASLQFVEEQILQTRNELAICDTARLAYAGALKREMSK
jgi:hypothetical protein